MSKIKKVKKVEIPVETPIIAEPLIEEKPKLGKFDFEFNNEGLNKLRDKLNEIIAFLNK